MSVQVTNSCQSGGIISTEITGSLSADKKTATFQLPCKLSQIVYCQVYDLWIDNVVGSKTNKVIRFELTDYIKDILLRSYRGQEISTEIHAPQQQSKFPVSGWIVYLIKDTPIDDSNRVQIVNSENNLVMMYPPTSNFLYNETRFAGYATQGPSLSFSCEFGIRVKIEIDYIS